MNDPPDSARPEPPAPAPTASDRLRELRAGWRRRLPVYVLIGAGVLVYTQLFERQPRDIDVFFILSRLDVATERGRLDRTHLVELNAEIRDDGELLATTTWTFREGGAPLKVGPAHVRLRTGEYDVHFRLTFVTAGGGQQLFALRRRMAVGEAEHVLVDVAG